MPAITPNGQVRDVSEFLSEIEKTGLPSQRNAHVGIWYRGQPTAGNELVPEVYRSKFNVTDEKSRLVKEQQIMQDFRVQSAGLISPSKNEVNFYFIQQHYGLPTRLLDWTQRPLAALYFATTNPAVDGDVFIMDAANLLEHQGAPADHQGVSTARRRQFREQIQVISNWKEFTDFDKFIIPVRPDQQDTRIILQQGCFTFHVPQHLFYLPKKTTNYVDL